MPPKVLIGVNFVQLAQRVTTVCDDLSVVGGVVSYSAVCKDIIM